MAGPVSHEAGGGSRHALIVYANPEPASFTGAMKEIAAKTLAAAGWSVEISDLYAEGFNPVADRHDFTSVADPARFHYQTEQKLAHDIQAFSAEIVREQARMQKADLLIVLFPLWWGGMPAILKGWFDRVLAYGFAYVDGARFESGLFRGRRGLLGVVTGGTPQRFTRDGTYGDIGQVLWPVQRCMLEYLGLNVAPPFVAYAAPRIDAAARDAYLEDWAAKLQEIARQ